VVKAVPDHDTRRARLVPNATIAVPVSFDQILLHAPTTIRAKTRTLSRRHDTGAPLETALYLPVKRFLEKLGFTVKGEVGGCEPRGALAATIPRSW